MDNLKPCPFCGTQMNFSKESGMTQKERLADLLDEFWLEHFDSCNTDAMTEHLLSNGVIVPPCKVGDFVYGIYPVENKEIIIRDWIFAVEAVDYESLHLIYKTEQFCFDEDSIGEDVFMNFEEAEQALKERDGK